MKALFSAFILLVTFHYAVAQDQVGTVQTAAQDSVVLAKVRATSRQAIDSLNDILLSAPKNADVLLHLANTYYDCQYWTKAASVYEQYLTREPWNVNARVDYARALIESSGDYPRGLKEIEKALDLEPEHANALFNYGVYILQQHSDNYTRAELQKASDYFIRAKKSYAKQKNAELITEIDGILQQIEEAKKTLTSEE
jgi:tetratricopeptide (TPR) repeat protein